MIALLAIEPSNFPQAFRSCSLMWNSRSINATNRPVRPPIFPRAFPTPLAAPLIAGPAAEETFDSPSEALLLYSLAVCEAFEAVSFAASVAFEAVDSNLAVVRPIGSWVVRRRAARDTANDMIREEYAPERLKEMILEILEGEVGVQWIGRGSARKLSGVRKKEEKMALR